MKPLGHHVRIRLESDRLLHASPEERRVLARAVYRSARPWNLLAFGCAGAHLHLVVLDDREAAGELARRLEICLQRNMAFGGPFLRVHRKELADQRHALQAVIYDLGQRRHHQIASDPCLEATSAPDLLGARLVGGALLPRVRERLPELRRRHVLAAFGLADLGEPAEESRPERLLDAVLAASALPSLAGHAIEARWARRALVALAGPALGTAELADLCGTSTRMIQRLRKGPVPDALLRAARIQLALRQGVDGLGEEGAGA
jgi:hypothetical protein